MDRFTIFCTPEALDVVEGLRDVTHVGVDETGHRFAVETVDGQTTYYIAVSPEEGRAIAEQHQLGSIDTSGRLIYRSPTARLADGELETGN